MCREDVMLTCDVVSDTLPQSIPDPTQVNTDDDVTESEVEEVTVLLNSTSSTTRNLTKAERIAKARTFMWSIVDPADTSIDRMSCPRINETRYSHLRASRWEWERKAKYFFAMDLRQCVGLLPRLLGSLVEAIRFLGPKYCAVSIIEGNSDDGTLEVLELLADELKRLGVPYYLRSSAVNPNEAHRIERLALLRSMALEPITGIPTPDDFPAVASTPDEAAKTGGKDDKDLSLRRGPRLELSKDATVIFVNDVAACAEDLLELVHQRVVQSADMTCAMDWSHPGGGRPFFYDVWVSRALDGALFFDIPANTGGWEHAADLFPTEPVAKARQEAGQPFQVFACWNGATAFAASAVTSGDVGFRGPKKGECFQGEPQLFCKDMWFSGRGKIAVVPSVNLEYTDEMGRRTKKEKGFVSDWTAKEQPADPAMMINWKLSPPEKVLCMPAFAEQSWLPWNESLVKS
jgi:alpha-1,3-mannosyltransferase